MQTASAIAELIRSKILKHHQANSRIYADRQGSCPLDQPAAFRFVFYICICRLSPYPLVSGRVRSSKTGHVWDVTYSAALF